MFGYLLANGSIRSNHSTKTNNNQLNDEMSHNLDYLSKANSDVNKIIIKMAR